MQNDKSDRALDRGRALRPSDPEAWGDVEPAVRRFFARMAAVLEEEAPTPQS